MDLFIVPTDSPIYLKTCHSFSTWRSKLGESFIREHLPTQFRPTVEELNSLSPFFHSIFFVVQFTISPSLFSFSLCARLIKSYQSKRRRSLLWDKRRESLCGETSHTVLYTQERCLNSDGWGRIFDFTEEEGMKVEVWEIRVSVVGGFFLLLRRRAAQNVKGKEGGLF